MWKLFTAGLVLSAACLMGCSEETERAKTPGSETTPAKADTFQLKMPPGASNVAKGGDEKVTIGVDRGENFTKAISLSFSPPEGVTLEPASPEIAAGQDEVEVTVKVDAEAATGEKSIPVTGKGEDKESSGSFKIEVTE